MYIFCKIIKDLIFLEHEDGTLEFMAAPVALMPQNNMVSPTLIKTVDGSFILQPVCALNSENSLKHQATSRCFIYWT